MSGGLISYQGLSPILRGVNSCMSEAGSGRAGDEQRTREQPLKDDHTGVLIHSNGIQSTSPSHGHELSCSPPRRQPILTVFIYLSTKIPCIYKYIYIYLYIYIYIYIMYMIDLNGSILYTSF